MDVIALRELELRSDARRVDVRVQIGRPTRDADLGSWSCRLELWVGEECQAHETHGEDSMQALQLTLASLDVLLHHAIRGRDGSLYLYDEPFVSMLEDGGIVAKNSDSASKDQ